MIAQKVVYLQSADNYIGRHQRMVSPLAAPDNACGVRETIGTFYFHWDPPALWEIETDEGFSLEDLM